MKPKPAQEHWYHVSICLHEFGQRLVAPRLRILEIFRVIGAKPHHHGKVADLGGDEIYLFFFHLMFCLFCFSQVVQKQTLGEVKK